MKAPISTMCLAAAALAFGACPPPAPQFTAQDEATTRAMFDATVANFRAANFDKWSQQFTETAVLQPPNAKSVHGRAAILAWGKAFPAIEEISFGNVWVAGEGNMAYGGSDYVLKLKGMAVDSGKQLVVFKRSAGGTWEVPAASFNSDLPLPMAMPPKAPAKK